ncbi:MAG: hypothetical protein JXM70_15195 [Pirellulales bacterium]|nr:hypothetical protein [Pirellulales bacterium]
MAHYTVVGNKKDVQTVQHIVKEIERRIDQSHQVWVFDHGMISQENIAFFSVPGRYYLISTRRSELESFQDKLTSGGWQTIREEVQGKSFVRD